MLLVELITFGFAWWLGLYLLRREETAMAVKLVAAGLLLYSVALALSSAENTFPQIPQPMFTLFYLLPAACWAAALWFLRDTLRTIPARWRSAESPQTAIGLILVSSVTFALGTGLLLLQLDWLPRWLLLVAIGFDLLLIGYAVGVLDAFEQGEQLRADFLRSLIEAEVVSTFFLLQLGAIALLSAELPRFFVPLAYMMSASAVAVAVFWSRLQRGLDGVVFGRNTPIEQQRTELRGIADALPRVDTSKLDWDEQEFTKLVRRALSNMGNLPKLATSPLLYLPLVDQRIAQKGLDESILVRSAELKMVLTESIGKLKPASDREFDSTDAWRHFNALYFPYVRGLRPYSRRLETAGLDAADREALVWFQREIPQRTLYNWQNAGAKLISAELQQQL